MYFALREFQKRSKKVWVGFHFPYQSELRLGSQCNWRHIRVTCFPLPSAKGFTNIRDHSYSEFPCCFFDWGVFLVVVFVGVFLFLVGVFGGACETFLFEKLHAQFAYYKSPELGLNLSGS